MERIIKTLAILTVLLLATSTSALALNFSDVGGFDEFKTSGNINPSSESELNWIASVYGLNAADITYTKWEGNTGWTPTDDDASAHYFDFGTTEASTDPFAFLIKGGSTNALTYTLGSTTATGSHLLFTNKSLFQYGVIDFDWLTGPNGSNFTIETISHTSAGYGGGGGEEEIPEPSTLALLGLGLVGLAVYRRKRN